MNPDTALRGWSEVSGRESDGHAVEILKDRSASHVYRLVGAGPGGANVVAKRCTSHDAVTERMIYLEVLRDLPFRSLHYYGLVHQRDERFCWVFVEDAGGVPYSPADYSHGRLAAEWLADLHTLAPASGRRLGLPERGPGWYLGCARTARDRILHSGGNPALSDDDRAVLLAIAEQCDAAEAGWRWVEASCSAVSPTFVHADLHTANIRVSPVGELLVFDWESAGWGPPAIDLALTGLDLDAYWTRVKAAQPAFAFGLVEELAAVGRLFQLLAHIEWEARALDSPWPQRSMKHMRYYLEAMSEALRRASGAEHR